MVKMGKEVAPSQVYEDAKQHRKLMCQPYELGSGPDPLLANKFWLVKHHPVEDPNSKAKLEQVIREIRMTDQRICQIIEQLKPFEAAFSVLVDQSRSLTAEDSQISAVINEKREEMEHLQDALRTERGRGVGIFSTDKELKELIRSLGYQIQHEEEKEFARDIKGLEEAIPKLTAIKARATKNLDDLGPIQDILDQFKLLETDLDGARKQKAALDARMHQIGSQANTFDALSKPLREELKVLYKKMDDASKTFHENISCYQNAMLLAFEKDLKGLEDLVNAQVDEFMSQWNSSKTFRDDYVKRSLVSLDMRQLSRDGRMRNPDEKAIMMTEVPEPETSAPPSIAKGQQENALRQRKSVKTRSTLVKAIVKEKYSNSYSFWASASAAAVVVVLLLALGYTFLWNRFRWSGQKVYEL